jgi:hypothetical protein|tara:strand:- start:998 stop:1210 length:213 start_codon:yes stop_codon:yes gene_type:complete
LSSAHDERHQNPDGLVAGSRDQRIDLGFNSDCCSVIASLSGEGLCFSTFQRGLIQNCYYYFIMATQMVNL